MNARTFHLGDLLTVTTGALVSPRHMDGVYDLLNYMTGDDLFTHQLPRAVDECRPGLLAQHPQLGAVEVPEFGDPAEVWSWLGEQVARFGEVFEVAPLDPADHARIDPLTELRMLRPDLPVVVVDVPDGGAS